MNLKQCFLTNNSCYKKGTKMKNLQPTGIVVHTVIEGGVPVTGVELSQTSLSIEVDSSYLLQAEIFPGNATNKAVTWCSCSSDVATVSEKGLIQAKTTGSVKITATTEDGNFSETCWVTIVPKGTLEQVPVESVSITSQEETYHLVKMGETLSLNATVMPAAATNKEVVWLSEDASIATVDTNGVIHPRSEGEVKITATSVAGGKTAEYWVKAVPASFVEDVVIDLAYKSGNTYQFVATTVPATATGKLVWTSSDPSILSIDDDGVGSRLKDGPVTITATAKTNVEDVANFGKEKACHENVDWWIVAIGIVAFLTGVSLAEDFLPGDSPAEALLAGTFSALVLGRLIYHFFIKDDENDNDVGDVTDKVPEDSIENDDEYIEEPTPGPTETPKDNTEENIPQKYVRIVENGVCARSSPTKDDSNKILLLESDTYLKYLTETSDNAGIPWYQVQLFDGVEGFVCSKYYDPTEQILKTISCVEEEVSANTVVDEQGNVLYYHCARPKNFKEYRMMVNALYIYDYLIVQSSEKEFKGLENKITFPKWTPNAIYGLLGNLAVESRMNPDNGGDSTTGGYGLTQWTPRDDPDYPDKYIPWARENYADADATLWNMDWQLDRIRYEVYRDSVDPNGGQWHSDAYGAGMTFTQYIQSNNDAADLGEAFLRGYEKPEVIINGPDTEREKSIATRRRLAENWKEFFKSNKQTLYVHEVE